MANVRRHRKRRKSERSSLQILEEAFHLVRTAPLGTLFTYFAGAIPFVAATLYFVADMSRSSNATRDSVFAAIFMVAAYFWLKFCQAVFAARLWESITPGHVPSHRGWKRFRYLSAMWCLQAFHLPALALASFFVLPMAWTIGAWQNMTVLSLTQDYERKPMRRLLEHSFRNSHYEWAQNHGILIIVGFLSLFLWVNILATCIIVPSLLKMFFGIESLFTINPAAAIMNSTFLIGTFLITYLCISPLLKSVYVLRCFYADSRETGLDLLSRLAECKREREKEEKRDRVRKVGNAAVFGLAFTLFFGSSGKSVAAPSGDSVELRDAITETMEQKKYQWRLSRLNAGEEGEGEQSWFEKQLTAIADSLEEKFRAIQEAVDEFFRKLFSQDKDRAARRNSSDLAWGGDLGVLNSVLLIIVVALILFWLVPVVVREFRNRKTDEFEEDGISGVVDLESDDIVASQLPEDEWMRLAREQISKGDTRLAIRALFLASLAHLGDRGLLKIARFKSNRDYRRELELRARNMRSMRDAFEENTGLFERVWYGLHQIGDEAVDHFMENYERISKEQERTEPSTTG